MPDQGMFTIHVSFNEARILAEALATHRAKLAVEYRQLRSFEVRREADTELALVTDLIEHKIGRPHQFAFDTTNKEEA